MGIKGLMKLLQSKYPETIVAYPERWASPVFRNSRIALDGSLLTNRFFFAEDKEDELASKRVIIGWHALITRLRKSKVKPVVVYDERGLRAWKAVETQRRLDQRSLNLARSLHEEQRSQRHKQFGDLVQRFGELAESERIKVAEAVQKLESEGVETLDADDASATLARTYLDLRDSLRSSSRPYSRRPGLQRLSSESASDDADCVDARERVFDDPIPPSANYTETPRQTALTAEEDILQQQLLGLVQDSPLPRDDLLELRRSLDDLEERSKVVAAIHERSLDVPSEFDHAEVRELLDVLGVPVIDAPVPYEAEGVASALVKAGLVDWVGTEDSDVIAYEAKLLRNVTVSSRPLLGIDGAQVRQRMKLDKHQFLDLMTLAGNDAIQRLYRIGPTKALQLLRVHGSIEGILSANEAIASLADNGYLDNVAISREMFSRLPPFPDQLDLDGPPVDDQAVEAFLEERHGLILYRLEERASQEEAAAESLSPDLEPTDLIDEAEMLAELQRRPLE